MDDGEGSLRISLAAVAEKGLILRVTTRTDSQRIQSSLIMLCGAVTLGLLWWMMVDAWAGFGIMSLAASVSVAYNRLRRDVGLPSWQLGIVLLYGWFFVMAPTMSLMLEGGTIVPGGDLGVSFAYGAAGIVCLWVGARVGKRMFVRKRASRLSSVAMAARTLGRFDTWVLVTLIGVGATIWSFRYGYSGLLTTEERVGPWAGMMSTLSQCVSMSMCIAWCKMFEASKARDARSVNLWRLCAFGIFVFGEIQGLIINSKAGIVEPLVVATVSYLAIYGKVPRKAIAVGALIYCFVSFPFIAGVRSQGQFYDLSRGDYAKETVSYFVEGQWFGAGSDLSSGVVSLGRGVFAVFTDVVNSAGRSIPFLDGETFVRGMQSLIPQAIGGSRMEASVGNYVGVTLGYVDSRDQRTNIAITQMGEWCLNFGLVGLCAGMFLWGVAASFVDFRIGDRMGPWMRAWLFLAVRWQEGYFAQTVVPFTKEVAAIAGLVVISAVLGRALRGRKAGNRPDRRREFAAHSCMVLAEPSRSRGTGRD